MACVVDDAWRCCSRYFTSRDASRHTLTSGRTRCPSCWLQARSERILDSGALLLPRSRHLIAFDHIDVNHSHLLGKCICTVLLFKQPPSERLLWRDVAQGFVFSFLVLTLFGFTMPGGFVWLFSYVPHCCLWPYLQLCF